MLFQNREHAARLLVRKLSDYKNKNPLVLAIPRGAVPMARIIAESLHGELDVVLVRKLGHPMQPELAIGAIDETGCVFLSDYAEDVDPDYLESEKDRQLKLLRERRARYTPIREPIDAANRVAIVVDDGVATGSTMMAALRAVRRQNPAKLIAAVAVASQSAAGAISREADELVCLYIPLDFYAVGQFFKEFSQVTDEDVIEILQAHEAKLAATA